jgi:hypothetical protein
LARRLLSYLLVSVIENEYFQSVDDVQGYQESSMKTRTIYHSDGRIEFRRIMTPRSLKDWDRNFPLAYERSILWLKPLGGRAFVRVAVVRNARSRRGPLLTENSNQMVLGYSKLTTDAPLMPGNEMCYLRRIFYVTQQDIMLNELSGLNQNCLRPSSILPTVWGEQFTLSEEDSFQGTFEELVGR